MSQNAAVQANPKALIESLVRKLHPSTQDDTRQLMQLIVDNLTALSPGGNLIAPGGLKAGAASAPLGVTFAVAGANGNFTVTITNPSSAKAEVIWHEISYSPLISFTQNVTTLPASSALSINVPAPGQSYYFRMRSSFDKKTWSAYQLASTSAISAGLVQSGAVSQGGAFNQTNYAVVASAASGAAAAVTINGTGGAFTPYVRQLGLAQGLRPSATIVGVPPGSEQFVGYAGNNRFQVKPTLAGVLADNLEPVGAVSVVQTGVPALPTVSLVLGAGGTVIAWNVTSQGNGLTAPVSLAIVTGTGSGATPGAQTIVAGKLISVAPGNPGTLYAGGDTVTVGGGVGGGTTGGGTALGTNGGRMTNV